VPVCESSFLPLNSVHYEHVHFVEIYLLVVVSLLFFGFKCAETVQLDVNC